MEVTQIPDGHAHAARQRSDRIRPHPAGALPQGGESLEFKEVIVGEGERRRRYAVCFNPLEARRQKARREELVKELEVELASLAEQGEGYSKRACTLRTRARYGRLLKETAKGLERAIEHACQDTWRNIRDDLKQIQLAQLSSPNGTVRQVTDPG